VAAESDIESGNAYFKKKQSKNTIEEYNKPLIKEYSLKIVVAGDGGVGKTCLLNRYISNTFLTQLKMTIGSDFFSKVMHSDDNVIKLQLWDFGGEKRFRFLLPSYCKGASGVILVFDLTDFKSLMNLEEWLQLVREHTKDPILILVGTKADVAESCEADFIHEFCKKNGIEKFIPTSAKTGENIERIFQELVKLILEKIKRKRVLGVVY